MTRVRIALATAAVALATACTGSSGGSAAPPPTTAPSSPPPAPTPTAMVDPAARLSMLTRAATGVHYSAAYALHSKAKGSAPSRVDVALAGRTVRVALVSKGATALYLSTRRAVVECEKRGGHHTSCFTVPAHHGALPGYLDPGIEHVFVDYPARLASRPGAYRISAAGMTPAHAGVPPGTCFRIVPRSSHDEVARGTYCFAADGVVTQAVFASGRLVLTHLGPAPDPRSITPPVSPTPLP